MQIQIHPDRAAIMAELHARPVDILEGEARVRRVVFAVPLRPGAVEEIAARLGDFCREQSIAPPERGARQFSYPVGPRAVTWEFHTEFVTITWRSVLSDKTNWPEDIGLAALGDAALVAASRIDVIAARAIPERLVGQFNLASLCVSTVEDGVAEVATDFVTDADGFTRFEFAAGGLTPLRRSVLTRRLLEIDTYRSMALLALPLARQVDPTLVAIERDLTTLFSTLPQAISAEDIQAALTSLHDLSIRSGTLAESISYRFAASRAYGNILQARLQSLHEGSTAIGSSITRYLNNRVEPALATCAALEKRLGTLTDKIERAMGLLNVRIGLDLQIQNKTVLETIASTAQSQFRLQRTVEGLSVIAISYYALGVLGYVAGGPIELLGIDKTIALSVASPLIVILVWLFIRAIRRGHTS